jgi:hypothetical protein
MQRIGDVTGDALAVLREARGLTRQPTAAEVAAEVEAMRWVGEFAQALKARAPALHHAESIEEPMFWARRLLKERAAGAFDNDDLPVVLQRCYRVKKLPARVDLSDLVDMLVESKAERGRVARDRETAERIGSWRRTDGSAVRDAFRGLSWAKDLGLLDGAPMATVMERAASPDPGAALARTLGVERGAQVAALVRLAGQVRVALERVAEAERAAQARMAGAEDADERRAARRGLDDARAEGQRMRTAIEARAETRCQAIARGQTTW